MSLSIDVQQFLPSTDEECSLRGTGILAVLYRVDFRLLNVQQEVARSEAEEVKAYEQRARSDMEHEALLKLEAQSRAADAEKAQGEALEARASVEQEVEGLRGQVVCAYLSAVPIGWRAANSFLLPRQLRSSTHQPGSFL